jgi:hypothetical protein
MLCDSSITLAAQTSIVAMVVDTKFCFTRSVEVTSYNTTAGAAAAAGHLDTPAAAVWAAARHCDSKRKQVFKAPVISLALVALLLVFCTLFNFLLYACRGTGTCKTKVLQRALQRDWQTYRRGKDHNLSFARTCTPAGRCLASAGT